MKAQAKTKVPAAAAARPAGLAPKQVYDVVVLGSQLGGLVAGALLAKRGYRVLHVDHDGTFDGYADGGFVLPFGPTLLPPPKALPSLHAVLDELGLATDVSRALEPYPELQVLLPKARLGLPRDGAARARELRRAFGDDADPLAASIDRSAAQEEAAAKVIAERPLPAEGFWERWQLGRLAGRERALVSGDAPLGEDHELSRALRALAPFATHLDEPPTALTFARTLAPLLRAPHRYPGGLPGLAWAIRKTLPGRGGDLLGERGHPAIGEELVLERGAFAGVKLLGAPAPHRARVCIAATDAAALRRLVPPSRRQRKLSDLADAVRARRFLFTVNLVLPREALPPGLGEVAVVAPPPDGDGIELSHLLLQVTPAEKERGDASGLCTVSAGAFLDASVRERGEEGLKAAERRVREVLSDVLPFHEQHVLVASAPYLASVGSRGSRLLPHPLLEVSLPRKLGVEGLPAIAPIARVIFAGREVLPGLGLEGEILAGQRAAELAAELCRKVDPLV